MFLLGIVSLFQMIFLPGWLIVNFLGIKKVLPVAFYSFGLSFIVNYSIVFILASLHIYTREILFLIVAFELIVFLWLIRYLFSKPLLGGFLQNLQSFAQEYKDHIYTEEAEQNSCFNWIIKGLYLVLPLWAIVAILLLVSRMLPTTHLIFTQWDAVVSFNRWAVDWASNSLPSQTWHYPQLIPANWSITYVMMGTTGVQSFAKMSMWLFDVAPLIMLFYLGYTRRQPRFFLSVLFTAPLIARLGSLGNGYVDSAVAFFGFGAFLSLILAKEANNLSLSQRHVGLGAILAAGAAVTKQAGLFIFAIYPLLYFFILYPHKSPDSKRTKTVIILTMLIGLALVGSWYLYKELEIVSGNDISEVSWVTQGIYIGASYPERALGAITLLDAALTIEILGGVYIPGAATLLIFVLLLALAYRETGFREVILLVILPFFMIWALFFSYGTNNLNLILPFVGLTLGVGAASLNSIAGPKLESLLLRIRVWQVAAVAVAIVGGLSLVLDSDWLLQRDRTLRRKIGSDATNQILYEYDKTYGLKGLIATEYAPLQYLPDLQEHYYPSANNTSETLDAHVNNPTVHYLLIGEWFNPQTLEIVQERIDAGEFTLIAETDDWWFVDLNKDR